MSQISVVLVTVANDQEASTIARTLVEERLAACVQILPTIRSIYHWRGEIFDEQERLLIMKTASAGFPALCERVRELHPYEVPEIVSIPITEGLPDYLRWVLETTGSR